MGNPLKFCPCQQQPINQRAVAFGVYQHRRIKILRQVANSKVSMVATGEEQRRLGMEVPLPLPAPALHGVG